MAKTVQSSTRVPGAARLGGLALDPDRMYVVCEGDVDPIQFVSPAYELEDFASIVNPGEPMYKRETEVNPRALKGRGKTLLSCSKADHEASQLQDVVNPAYLMEGGLNKKSGADKNNPNIQGQQEAYKRDKGVSTDDLIAGDD
jgi:hypothetical protein